MKKSLIALAAVGAFAGSAMAQSSLTVYGIIDLGLVKQSKGDTAGLALGGVGVTNKEVNVAQATRSRLGFRGVEDLGGGLSVKFDLEHRLLPDTGAQNGASFWDKSIVGITSQTYGELVLGRDYMPLFFSQYLLDPWLNQGIAELGASTYAWAGYARGGASALGYIDRGARYNNGVFYKAQAAGFTVILGASLKEGAAAKNRLGFNVMYNAGPLFVTASYDQAEETAGRDDSVYLVGAAYDFGFIKPRVSYTQSELFNSLAGGKHKPSAWTVAATVPVSSGLFKMGYQSMDFDIPKAGAFAAGTTSMETSKFSLGYEHTLSKRTAVYADVTSGKVDAKGLLAAQDLSVNGFDIGIRHSF